jgi:hypothetical protein
MGENVLNLADVANHDTVTLPDGKEYELINRSDFGLLEIARLQQLQQEDGAIRASGAKRKSKKLTPAQEKALMRILGESVKMLIPTITPRVLAMLKRPHREQIVLAWIGRNTEAASGEA